MRFIILFFLITGIASCKPRRAESNLKELGAATIDNLEWFRKYDANFDRQQLEKNTYLLFVGDSSQGKPKFIGAGTAVRVSATSSRRSRSARIDRDATVDQKSVIVTNHHNVIPCLERLGRSGGSPPTTEKREVAKWVIANAALNRPQECSEIFAASVYDLSQLIKDQKTIDLVDGAFTENPDPNSCVRSKYDLRPYARSDKKYRAYDLLFLLGSIVYEDLKCETVPIIAGANLQSLISLFSEMTGVDVHGVSVVSNYPTFYATGHRRDSQRLTEKNFQHNFDVATITLSSSRGGQTQTGLPLLKDTKQALEERLFALGFSSETDRRLTDKDLARLGQARSTKVERFRLFVPTYTTGVVQAESGLLNYVSMMSPDENPIESRVFDTGHGGSGSPLFSKRGVFGLLYGGHPVRDRAPAKWDKVFFVSGERILLHYNLNAANRSRLESHIASWADQVL